MIVAELTSAQLDYWVAKAGEEWKHFDVSDTMTLDPSLNGVRLVTYGDGKQAAMLQPNNPFRQDPREFCPSSHWAHGGPIIEREKIELFVNHSPLVWSGFITKYPAGKQHYTIQRSGESPLIAAMRCFVASKFGDAVSESEAA